MATMWSYLSGFFILMYLVAPPLYLFFGWLPITAFSFDFFVRIIPYLVANQLLFTVFGWGLNTWRGQQNSLAMWPIWVTALVTSVRNVYFGIPLGFVVTPKTRLHGGALLSRLRLVRPQLVHDGRACLRRAVGPTAPDSGTDHRYGRDSRERGLDCVRPGDAQRRAGRGHFHAPPLITNRRALDNLRNRYCRGRARSGAGLVEMTSTRHDWSSIGELCELRSGRALFLSSHYDDVALSCGGTVALLADGGRRRPWSRSSVARSSMRCSDQFARWKHSRWGLTDMDAVRDQRQYEDLDAAAALRARTRWLGLPDAIYRGERHVSDQDLYGSVQAAEVPLASLIADEIQALPEWADTSVVFVPLAAGATSTISWSSWPGSFWRRRRWRCWRTRTAPT